MTVSFKMLISAKTKKKLLRHINKNKNIIELQRLPLLINTQHHFQIPHNILFLFLPDNITSPYIHLS